MYSRLLRAVLLTPALLWLPASAAAQDIPTTCTGWERLAVHTEQVRAGHLRLREKAEITCDTFKFFADHLDVFTDEDRVVATGNVLFTTPDTRISASKVEFNLKTKTGVFYDATGSSKVKPQIGTKSMFGTQEADMYFHGEKLEKLGDRKYRITDGGFTTCLQPTARWEFTSGSFTIHLDRYAIARNTIFRVKGVPLAYLPIIYYPLDDDDRATGFLLPGYGMSDLRGQTIRNAFFWAIGRSADLTLEHNFFSKAGQAYGGEFRYILSPGSEGRVAASFLNERAYETVVNGQPFKRDAGRTTQIVGSLVHDLPGTFRAGATADYTSNITTRQLYQQNLFDFTNSQSSIRGNISGSLAGWQMGGEVARTEVFGVDGESRIGGTAPRITLARAEQAIPGLPVYWGLSSEGVGILDETRPATGEPTQRNLVRADVQPIVRAPLSKLAWLQATTVLSWRGTWWSRSLDENDVIVDEPISRNFFELQGNFVGPVFSRIFNTPGLRYAQRWKHVIEPSLSLSRTTGIDKEAVLDRIVRHDSTDRIVGSTTRLSYGLTNRLYSKRGEGPQGVVREVAALTIQQTYYTDPQAALADQRYRNVLTDEPLSSKFSPISFSVRASPVDGNTIEFTADYDAQFHAVRQLNAGTTVRIRQNLDVSASWARQLLIPGLPGFSDPLDTSHYFRAESSLRTANNHFGGTYAFDYDLLRRGFLNQRVMAYYNAQCCGLGVEYQTVNRPAFAGQVGQVLDRQFNLSFTLAGIGTFSDFFGAFGLGANRR